MGMDNTAITNAQKLFAWASDQQGDSIFTLLDNVGISCNFTSMSADERLIYEAMGAQRLSEQWQQRMKNPTSGDAEAFIRIFLKQLDDKSSLAWPPIIGRTDMNNPATASGDSLSNRSDNTNYWEFHLCTRGETVYGKGSNQHLIKPGNLVLIPPGVRCSYLRTPSNRNWQHFWCQFDAQASWQSWCNLLHETENLTIMQLNADDTHRISELAQGFIDYSYPEDPLWFNRAVYNRIEALLIELSAAQPHQAKPLDGRVQNALTYIQEHFREEWEIASLASHCHLSAGRLSVLFKKNLGSSPMSLRDSLRMAEACNLLLNSQKPIGQIGEELGYTDPMHFSRRFSDLIGQSPRQYRSSQHQSR